MQKGQEGAACTTMPIDKAAGLVTNRVHWSFLIGQRRASVVGEMGTPGSTTQRGDVWKTCWCAWSAVVAAIGRAVDGVGRNLAGAVRSMVDSGVLPASSLTVIGSASWGERTSAGRALYRTGL